MNEPDANGGILPASTSNKSDAVDPVFGSPAQYARSAREAMADHEASITGATAADPAREQEVPVELEDAEWANPLSGVRSVTTDYVISFLTYWFTYSLAMAATIFMIRLFAGEADLGLPIAIEKVLAIGPVYALLQDVVMVCSASLMMIFGVFCLLVEFFLGLCFIMVDEWPQRLKYCLTTAIFVVCKLIIVAISGVMR